MRGNASSVKMAAYSSGGGGRISSTTSHIHGRDSLSAAAEAAAKVNAMLIAKGKLKPVHLNKINKSKGNSSMYDAEVEINDAPIVCRDILTRNAKQDEISKKSGAFISTKGRYMNAEGRQSSLTANERPLYLYIQAATERNVQRAVNEINDIISRNGGVVNQTRGASQPLVTNNDNSHLPNVRLPPPNVQQQPRPHTDVMPTRTAPVASLANQIQFITEKLYVGLEHAPPSFDVRGRMLGTGGSYLQHIHTSSGAVVTLRGRGSGYLDPKTAQESTEPMHIHLQHATVEGLQQAIRLGKDLIGKVQNDYSRFQQELALQPPAAPSLQPVSYTTAAVQQPTGSAASRSFVPTSLIQGHQVNFQHQPPPAQSTVVYQHEAAPPLVGAPPPRSLMMSQSHSAPSSNFVYSQSQPVTFVQAPHIGMPVTVSNARIGYNSLTSHTVQVVDKPPPAPPNVIYNNGDYARQPHRVMNSLHQQQVSTGLPPPTVISEPGYSVPPHSTVTSIVYAGQATPGVTTTPAYTVPPPSVVSNPIMHQVQPGGESQTVVLEVIQPVAPPDAPVEGYVVERVQSEYGQPPPLIQPGQILPPFTRAPPTASAGDPTLHGQPIVHLTESIRPVELVPYNPDPSVRLLAPQQQYSTAPPPHNASVVMVQPRTPPTDIPKLMDLELPPPGLTAPPVQLMTSLPVGSLPPVTVYEYRQASEPQPAYTSLALPPNLQSEGGASFHNDVTPMKRLHEEPTSQPFYTVAPPPPPPPSSHNGPMTDNSSKRMKGGEWYSISQ